ncbi:hypothetical protein [Sorangium sp. So ce204]|uniref:hypothetical protein n=1 Tax=Sorangium sp. So ce204 TaxID=3133288 RepID=UPI003F60C52B
MGVPCMPVRPSCFVQSIDLHGALGTLIAPPAPPVPFTPSDITMWFAFSNTHYGTGDRPVASVLICGEPLSFLLNLLFGGLKGTGKFFGTMVFKAIMRRIAPKLRGLLGKGLAPVFDWIVEKVSEKAGKVLGEQAGEAIGKWLGKAAEEKAKKATSDKLGGLSPDDLLGFGNDPPLWAR